ncbi:MAG: trigger factor [Anaerolineales bacterium]
MDVKTEHIEGHTARLTVNLSAQEMQDSMRRAAKRLAKQLRVPGFRPGKAPYHVIESYLGRGAILEEALEARTQDIYRDALERSAVEPADMGSMVDIQDNDGAITLTFEVPKAPEVALGDYRDYREELNVEPVSDEEVNEQLEELREQRAIIETVDRPAQVGDQLRAEIAVTWWHVEAHEDDDDAEDDSAADGTQDADDKEAEKPHPIEEVLFGDDDDDDDEPEGHEHVLLDDEDAIIILREPDDERDMLPGLSARLVGAGAEDDLSFHLDLPEDFEDPNLAGEQVLVEIFIHEVQSRTVPELTDTFAQTASDGQHETLLDLRIKMRENLQKEKQDEAQNQLFENFLEELVAGATFHYHAATLAEEETQQLNRLDYTLRQNAGLGLEDWMRALNKSEAELREQYRPASIKQLQQRLALQEFIQAERLTISGTDIDAEIDTLVQSFGEQAEIYRQIFDTDYARQDVAQRLISRKMVDRVVEIAQGTAPDLETLAAQDADDAAPEPSDDGQTVASDEGSASQDPA